MSKDLIALVGGIENGWNLQYIMRLRYQAKKYDRVIIYTEDWMEYLCEDFSDFFYPYKSLKGWRDRWLFNGKQPVIPDDVRQNFPNADKLIPTRRNCTNPEIIAFKYGQPDLGYAKYDVIIHARNIRRGDWIDKACGGNHNWPTEKWEKLVRNLKGRTICSIGSREEARHIEGTDDLRGNNLKQICHIIAHSKVVVGESSFPMHLASMCGCPHVVITHDRFEKSIQATNKERYKFLWNPFRTPCKIVEHPQWNPKTEDVLNKVGAYL